MRGYHILDHKWGFTKLRGPFLELPTILRIIEYWGSYWGSLILGNFQMSYSECRLLRVRPAILNQCVPHVAQMPPYIPGPFLVPLIGDIWSLIVGT